MFLLNSRSNCSSDLSRLLLLLFVTLELLAFSHTTLGAPHGVPFPFSGRSHHTGGGDVGGECTGKCLEKRNSTRQNRVEEIRRKILEGLNDSQGGEDGDDEDAGTPVVLFKENNYTARSADPDGDLLEFKLAPPSPASLYPRGLSPRVTKAKLFVLIRWRRQKRNKKSKKRKPKKRITLEIYKVDDQGEVPRQQKIADLRVIVHHTKWQKLLIPTWVVQDTFESTDHRLLLKIVCLECNQDEHAGPKPVLFYSQRKSKKYKAENAQTVGQSVRRDRRQDPTVRSSKVHKHGPYLQIRTKQRAPKQAPKRERRSLETCAEGDYGVSSVVSGVLSEMPCDNSPMYVSFEDFGWDKWIISPKGFYTNFCFGSCPDKVQSVWEKDNTNSAEEEGHVSDHTAKCCQTMETKPLSLQYYTASGNIKTSQLPDLVVTKCACS